MEDNDIEIKRIPIQFRYRNYWKNDGCGWQISFFPFVNLWHDEAWCIEFGWLGWCFQIWINGNEELI